MATQQQSRSQAQTTTRQPTEQEAGALLEQILQKAGSKSRAIQDALEQRVAAIEEVLPANMAGQAKRLAKRAVMTFNRNPDLQNCPAADFIRCVIEAAELGLAIDGKLCYVVKYKATYQMQPDFKGLIAVAKRSGQIRDIWCDVVKENDSFRAMRRNDGSSLEHEYPEGFRSRGETIGAYAVVLLPDGHWRYELMDREDLDRIQRAAPAKNGPWAGWAGWTDEMRKKSVIRRCLKLYCEDPAIARAIDAMDREFEAEEPEPTKPPLGRVSFRTSTPVDAPRSNGNSSHASRQEIRPAEGEVPNESQDLDDSHFGNAPDAPEETEQESRSKMEREVQINEIGNFIATATSVQDLERVRGMLSSSRKLIGDDSADQLSHDLSAKLAALNAPAGAVGKRRV